MKASITWTISKETSGISANYNGISNFKCHDLFAVLDYIKVRTIDIEKIRVNDYVKKCSTFVDFNGKTIA